MPRRTVYEAKVEFVQILDEDGGFDEKLGKDLISDEQVVELYEHMVTCRELDEIAFKLQRSGRMGTFPQNKGQEAAAIGTAHALIKGTDWLVPCYRENAALFMHGLPMHYILLHWMGDERGNEIPPGVNITPLCIPIGTHMLHAAGIAYASKLRNEGRVVATFFGDGATSEGDFHEAMNFASVFQAPIVFLCQNNQWAISVPRESQTASETFAQKAIAYGMPGTQVDGNDLFGVYKVVKEAVDRARDGGGPSLIEAVTYRLGDHTTADDARRYRDQAELDAWLAKDPLIRLRKYLETNDLWDDQMQTELDEKAKVIVREVVKTAEGIESPATEDLFNYTFANLPDGIITQRDTLRTASIGQNPAQIGLRTQRQNA
ncbi:MAG: pyruvate dehydrogenase (acetyl-transferring) E1 component subunit alpha [Planctomycetes bacterium]|nr:pyruvate dehydrogenase (acetyl-transferring) E1 component subunit alpha [Planctomycetota bacterium]